MPLTFPDGETCEWLEPESRRLFTLSPFKVRGQDADSVMAGGLKRLQKGGSSQWILTAAFDCRARVQRHHGSAESAAAKALDLAKRTGDPVVIGRQVGTNSGGMPVFESFGRVLTEKADPLSTAAFEEWAEAMTSGMTSVSRADLAALGTEALEHLSINFGGASVNEIDRALLGYRTSIASPTNRMMAAQRLEISKTLRRVIRGTGERVRRMPRVRQGLATGFKVNDSEVSRLLSQHHSFWVRDRHGQISETMSARARGIISAGVERGAGRQEIGRELARMTGDGLRQPHYYQTVAANHVARARSYTTGASYRAAGIEFYRIEAVLDDRTTHQCEFLHEKVLPTGPAVGRLERAMADSNPESILVNQPFIRDAGNRLTIPDGKGGQATVARIDQRSSGASPSGISSVFSGAMSQSDLVSHAVGFPPYHHQCRTTTVPM